MLIHPTTSRSSGSAGESSVGRSDRERMLAAPAGTARVSAKPSGAR